MTTNTTIPRVGDNVRDFAIQLSVPSLNPGNLEGSTGSIQVDAGYLKDPQLLRNTRFSLEDTEYGSLIGRISEVSWGNEAVVFTAETMLNRLNVNTAIRPMTLALSDGMDEILSQVEMVSSGLNDDEVTFPGWRGTLWDYLKFFCTANDLEIEAPTYDPDTLTFRSIRSGMFYPKISGISYTVNDQSLAKTVVLNKYTYGSVESSIEFTPASADNMQILAVNEGESVEYEVSLNAWVTSVNQPQVMDLVGPEERTDGGAYCVAGSDGLPVTAAQWTAQGGVLTVSLTDDPSVLKVTVTAPRTDSLLGLDGGNRLAPYSIAATAGSNSLYNSLHITGTGLRFTKTEITLPTGVDSEVTVEDVGVTVDNPWINDLGQAYSLGARTAQAWAGPTYRVSDVSANKQDLLYDILGCRFQGKDVIFRIENVTANSAGVQSSGVSDTTFQDFAEIAEGETFDSWSSKIGSLSFQQWATVPLRLE